MSEISGTTTTDRNQQKEIFIGPKKVEIPVDWDTAKLSEIACDGDKTFIDGDWVESNDMVPDGEYQLIQLGNIGQGHFKGECDKFVSEEFFNKKNCTLVEKGDLLISRLADPVLRTIIVPAFEKKSITAVDIVVAKVDENGWSKGYIWQLLNSKPLADAGNSLATGSTRQRISRSNMAKITIPRPPLAEQQRIFNILSAVEQQIQQTNELIQKTAELKQGLIQDLVTGGIDHTEYKTALLGPQEVDIPASWEVDRVGNLTEIVSGSTPKRSDPENWGGDIEWVTPTDVTAIDGMYIHGAEERITQTGLESCSTNLIEPGAVLMTSRATIGEAVINTVPVTTNQGFKSFVCGDRLHNEYLYYFIGTIADYLTEIGGGSTFPEINKGDTSNIRVPVPPLDEQKEIAAILNSADERRLDEMEYKRELQDLKCGLMQDLLTGKKRVGPAAD